MKSKYYNLAKIVPVFFALGVLLASFNYYLLSKEIKNGLNEEITSISIAMKVFLNENFILDDNDKLEKTFSRIIQFGRVSRIYLIKENKVLIAESSKELDDSKTEFRYKNAKLLEIVEYGDKGYYNFKFDLKNREYKLFITLNASKEKNSLEKIFYQALFIILIMLTVGVVISFILSYITKKNLKSLSLTAKSIANGNFDSQNRNYTIKEISDLANTLEIIKSILKEMLSKTKSTLLNIDNDKDVNSLKSSVVFNESTKLETANFEIAIAVNQNINEKEFFSCWNDDNFIYSFVGNINGENDYFKDHITLSSLTEMTRYLISTNSLDILKLKDMYKIKNMLVIKIDLIDNKLYLNKLVGEKVSNATILVNNDGVNIFNYNNITDIRLENYLKMYSHQDLNLLASDFQKIFDKETATIFIRNKI